jgi:hypothetical protein
MTDSQTGKPVGFGPSQLVNKTPLWAKWMFRITFIVTTALAFWMAATKLVPENIKFEVLLGFKSFDMLVWGFSKLFGVEGEPSEEVKQAILGE